MSKEALQAILVGMERKKRIYSSLFIYLFSQFAIKFVKALCFQLWVLVLFVDEELANIVMDWAEIWAKKVPLLQNYW